MVLCVRLVEQRSESFQPSRGMKAQEKQDEMKTIQSLVGGHFFYRRAIAL